MVFSLLVYILFRWQHSFKCVMEQTVERRRKNWSWEHMLWTKRKRTEYKDIYVKKLEGKTLSSKDTVILEVIYILKSFTVETG